MENELKREVEYRKIRREVYVVVWVRGFGGLGYSRGYGMERSDWILKGKVLGFDDVLV